LTSELLPVTGDSLPAGAPARETAELNTQDFVAMRNAQSVDVHSIPTLSFAAFRFNIVQAPTHHRRVAALFGTSEGGRLRLFCVLAGDGEGLLHVGSTAVQGASFSSITPECPQIHLFEREIAEEWGIVPEGHPWLKPVRFIEPLGPHGCRSHRSAEEHRPGIGNMDFYRVDGEEVHEVAVGPVHAGVIEPGHFRFQCHGEQVLHLEISLGYQHRGIERALLQAPVKRVLPYMETLAGDTTIGHALAYCQTTEALADCRVSGRAHALRAVALELERLANHVGGLGALANDVGYLPTASFCGRLRGDFLNLTAALCGNRFGRSFVRPGGVGFDVNAELCKTMLERLDRAQRDVRTAVNLLWDSASVQTRFEGTGTLSQQTAEELGLVGVSARACGLERDVRQDFPTGFYRLAQIPVSVAQTGDVFARAYVRWLEIQRSTVFVREQLQTLATGASLNPCGTPRPNRLCVSLIESWRGEVCHIAITDPAGRMASYKIVDPSFHNWMGLAMALRNQQISDFPLCNKSFDLSYCGHDL
jgi:Ni,Fe-hydrogenase III large subunit